MSSTDIPQDKVVHQDHVPGGRYWSFIVKPGHVLRLTDLQGGANVSALLYNAAHPMERYNMADTLKGQHTAHLTKGHCCYSDMGRVLVSIIEDCCGWHDTLCGVSDAAMVREKYGEADYQSCHNDFYRSGRELFLIELGKWGLGRRDLVANINFFSKVATDEDGNLGFVESHGQPGNFVDLRAEMGTLVILNTCQHPLDPNPKYAPKPIDITLWQADAVAEDDVCRTSRPENARALTNNAIWAVQA